MTCFPAAAVASSTSAASAVPAALPASAAPTVPDVPLGLDILQLLRAGAILGITSGSEPFLPAFDSAVKTYGVTTHAEGTPWNEIPFEDDFVTVTARATKRDAQIAWSLAGGLFVDMGPDLSNTGHSTPKLAIPVTQETTSISIRVSRQMDTTNYVFNLHRRSNEARLTTLVLDPTGIASPIPPQWYTPSYVSQSSTSGSILLPRQPAWSPEVLNSTVTFPWASSTVTVTADWMYSLASAQYVINGGSTPSFISIGSQVWINHAIQTTVTPALDLQVGDNIFRHRQISEDTKQTRDYTVTIHRVSNDPTISDAKVIPIDSLTPLIPVGSIAPLTLTPTFSRTNENGHVYLTNVQNSVDQVQLFAQQAYPLGSTWTGLSNTITSYVDKTNFDLTPMLSGSTSPLYPLVLGDNYLAIWGLAEDSVSEILYTFKVRRLSNEARLTQFNVSPSGITSDVAPQWYTIGYVGSIAAPGTAPYNPVGTWSLANSILHPKVPAWTPDVFDYTVTYNWTDTTTIVTADWMASFASASYYMNPDNDTPLSSYTPIQTTDTPALDLQVGDNIFKYNLISEDRTKQHIYTIKIHRMSNDPTMSNVSVLLPVGSGLGSALSPAFSPTNAGGTNVYSMSVPNSVATVQLFAQQTYVLGSTWTGLSGTVSSYVDKSSFGVDKSTYGFTPMLSGATSISYPLIIGDNYFAIWGVAEDTLQEILYVFKVHRQTSNAQLSALKISNGAALLPFVSASNSALTFNKDTLGYTMRGPQQLAITVNAITVKIDTIEPLATVSYTWNGVPLAGVSIRQNNPSVALTVPMGDSVLLLTVTGEVNKAALT